MHGLYTKKWKKLKESSAHEEEKVEAENEIAIEEEKEEKVEVKKRKDEDNDKLVSRRMAFVDNLPLLTTPLPFTQRFKKAKLDDQFKKFLKIFKKLKVNIPFAEALSQMPKLMTFMKKIMSSKRKLDAYGTVSL